MASTLTQEDVDRLNDAVQQIYVSREDVRTLAQAVFHDTHAATQDVVRGWFNGMVSPGIVPDEVTEKDPRQWTREELGRTALAHALLGELNKNPRNEAGNERHYDEAFGNLGNVYRYLLQVVQMDPRRAYQNPYIQSQDSNVSIAMGPFGGWIVDVTYQAETSSGGGDFDPPQDDDWLLSWSDH